MENVINNAEANEITEERPPVQCVNEPAPKKRKKRACKVHYSVDNEELLYKLADAGLLQKMHGVNFIGGKNIWFFSNDIVVVSEYVDRARSATTDNRPEFLRMIEDSKKRLFDVVLVHKLDRFARNRADSIGYRAELKRNDVSLISILEQLDDSPESLILESVLEAMAEYYSKNLSREVMKGMTENALKGLHTGGLSPLGYDVATDKKLIINENEAVIVKLIFQRTLEGYSYTNIIDELNVKGFRTKKGGYFGRNSLNSILQNEKYTGTYIFNKSVSKNVDGKRNSHKFKDDDEIIRIEDVLPQIISKEDFAKVQEKLSAYVFNDEYIPLITKEYNKYLQSKNSEYATQLKQYQSHIKQLDNDIDKLVNLLMKTNSQTLIDKLENCEKEKVQIETKLNSLISENRKDKFTESDIKVVFTKIRKALSSATLVNVKQIIDTYIDRIEIYPDEVIVRFNFFPDFNIKLDDKEKDRPLDECVPDIQRQSNSSCFSVSADDCGGGEGN